MNREENPFEFDRTAFKAETFEEADNHHGYWLGKSLKERWQAGNYLSMQMFGCNAKTPLDKTVSDKRKHAHA